MVTSIYVTELRALFEKNGNVIDALPMQAYMKDIAPFFGIKAPLRRKLSQHFIKTHGLPENPEATVQLLWKAPERELHYFAMELLGKLAKKAPENRLRLYETLITTNSWWDTVDYISPQLCGVHFRCYPQLCNPTVEQWISSENLWLQRSAILFQLGYKKDTDEELLFSVCSRLAGASDFFIRKAIGWALRQYARTAPAAVKAYVQKTELSTLSRKEALKHF
jgi:3-methyladenine DNA glycosylase AlkD